MTTKANRRFMQLALEAAARGKYRTAPNPMVGAVITRGGRILATGYHRRAGADHAEVDALKKAAESVRGSTMYVTLEPCNHTGRTGPCTDAIIEAGVRKVVVAVRDPHPAVSGRGLRALRKAGVDVETGVLRQPAMRLNEIYFGYHRNRRPFVIVKEAQSIDGRIATASGDSRWISDRESLRMAHRLRAEVDAVLVGMETVRRDNPSLTVRRVRGDNPYRIVLSSSLAFPRNCKLLEANGDYRTILATTEASAQRFSRARRGRQVIFWHLAGDSNGQLDPADLLDKAHAFGLQSVLVEGGGRVATSFFQAGLVDKYVAVMAPIVLGHGVNALGDLRIQRVADAVQFRRSEFITSGRDCLFVGYPRWRK